MIYPRSHRENSQTQSGNLDVQDADNLVPDRDDLECVRRSELYDPQGLEVGRSAEAHAGHVRVDRPIVLLVEEIEDFNAEL